MCFLIFFLFNYEEAVAPKIWCSPVLARKYFWKDFFFQTKVRENAWFLTIQVCRFMRSSHAFTQKCSSRIIFSCINLGRFLYFCFVSRPTRIIRENTDWKNVTSLPKFIFPLSSVNRNSLRYKSRKKKKTSPERKIAWEHYFIHEVFYSHGFRTPFSHFHVMVLPFF